MKTNLQAKKRKDIFKRGETIFLFSSIRVFYDRIAVENPACRNNK